MPRSLDNLLNSLKAAADPTRLRLLALLGPGELTVGELTQILAQSQPRVSRHLKLLCDAGLLERFKEEHSVYYRLPAGEGDVMRHLPRLMDPADPVLADDRHRRDAVMADRARRATDRLAEATAAGGFGEALTPTVGDLLLDELSAEPLGVLLDVGTGAGFLLKALAPQAVSAVGIDISTDALKLARTRVQGPGFGHCQFRQGDLYRLPMAAETFDTVAMGRVLGHVANPVEALTEAGRVLRPGGRLVLIDDFDEIEAQAGGNPLLRVREWLALAGLACERLRPIDTGESHLLITIARRPAGLKEVA